ncbi:MAG TPA: hypothetical protein VFN37_12820 [Candidatus Baltobacteraceae bacterium]|nr:hypothetical protein [Candidatus Baltobacteraceae bacterium]
MRIIALVFIVILSVIPALSCGAAQSEGRVVQLPDSKIQLLYVRSDWTSNYDVINHRQSPISFNDCVAFVSQAGVAVTHIRFLFAAVDGEGHIRRPPLSLDVRYTIEPGSKHDERANCREHGYANGDRGLWLVAWVSRVDFADGTTWTAPALNRLSTTVEATSPPVAHRTAGSYSQVQLLQTLGEHWPRFALYLEAAQPSAAVEALQRAGILSVVRSWETCQGMQQRLFITDYGERIAAQRGWYLQDGWLAIPVGRLVPIASSEVLEVHGSDANLAVNFRFEENSNAQYLRTLAKGSTWTITALPDMHLTLDELDRTVSARIPVVRDAHRGWIPLPGWSERAILCSD